MRPWVGLGPQGVRIQTIAKPQPADTGIPSARRRSRAHLVVPGLLTAVFCFRAGGYFPFWTGVGAVALCLALVARVTLSERPLAGWSTAATVAALGGAGLASWTLASAAWSHAPERALVEFDRALLYTALVALMAMAPRRPGDLTIVLRWVLLALIAACVAGLASRLAPDVFPISARYLAERLSFPLTYWNATGLASALAVILALHHASGAEEPPWMLVLASAALPIAVATLYFTFSRGAIAACALGLVAYLVLGATRRMLFVLVAAGPPVGLALWACWQADLLATDGYFRGGGPAQGHRVALALAGCAAAAAVLRLLLVRFEDRRMARARRVPRSSALRIAAAAIVLVAALAVMFGVPGRIADEARTFGKGDFVTETGDARDRLTAVNANGRPDLWKASLDAFSREPLHGTGAGTFRLVWQQERTYFWKVADGHSLYLEVLGELGIVGGVLLALFVFTPIVVALRRLGGPERHAHAAFLAVGLTLLVHAGVDWDWEMPALFVGFFGAAGVVLASARGDGPGLGRVPRIVAGLACLLLAVTPVLMAVSQSRLDQAFAAFRERDCAVAIDDALAAGEALPRAQASEIIGYCDLRARQAGLAIRAMEAARARDPENWQYAYGLAIAQAIAGQDPRPAAGAALRLNPYEPLARDLAREMRSPSPKRRFRAAARAVIPSE
jgi:O-Antigen ligase